MVAKLLFLPMSVCSGLVAGLLSKKTFDLVWGKVDDRAVPKPDQRTAELRKLALALAVEGAVFRTVKGLVDHGSRRGFEWLTGFWPGEDASRGKGATR
jgi:hypothetical protein